MYTSPSAQVHKFSLEKCVRPVKLRVSFFWCLLRALKSSGLQEVKVKTSCVCVHRAPCTELLALVLFFWVSMGKMKPMGNHTTEARCPRTPRLQLPGWTEDQCQEELGGGGAWVSLKSLVQRTCIRWFWERWVKGKQVGEKEHVKQE